MSRPVWGVAICLPTSIIPDMLEQCNNVLNAAHDDTLIGKYLVSKGIKVLFPIPSLVDHRYDIKSLVGDPGKFRRAAYFIDKL